jgi:murein DD-endopeptidase MepM/ murein hydrolase activator NlpD
MSSRECNVRLGLPTTHYFVSISRGDSIRTASVRPAALWILGALAPLSLAFGLAGAADLALRARLPEAADVAKIAADATIGSRQSETRALPNPESAIEDRIRDLAARQARLERRGADLAALAAEATALSSPAPTADARPGSDALGAIETLGPRRPDEPSAREAIESGAVRAYAPAGATLAPKAAAPHPFDTSRAAPALAPSLAEAALSPDLDAKTRLDLVVGSLDRLDNGQLKALAAIDRRAARDSRRNGAILAEAGLDPDKLAVAKPLANAGGPLIPIDVDPHAPAFEQAEARVQRDVSRAEGLQTLMPFVPLRRPLAGEASVTSPFGYRRDPFLGLPALHTGVDLLQPYGAEIRATGAGRVTHAGPMGGYGDMVEIDHGAGLTTRYAHMSEILVAEGQTVAAGDVLGRLGSTGRSTGPHLHYEVRVDGEPVDPERFMRAGEQLTPAE